MAVDTFGRAVIAKSTDFSWLAEVADTVCGIGLTASVQLVEDVANEYVAFAVARILIDACGHSDVVREHVTNLLFDCKFHEFVFKSVHTVDAINGYDSLAAMIVGSQSHFWNRERALFNELFIITALQSAQHKL